MNRDDALGEVRKNVKNENLIRHMIATEAIMKELARQMSEDEEKWGLAGLLHDIDVEITEGDMNSHGVVGSDLVRELDFDEDIAKAVLAHNETLGIPRETTIEKALFCADPLTGLITAAALIRPEKKLEAVQAKSVRKRFKEKSFAAGASREGIAACSEIGFELDEFIALGLKAMQGVAEDLGL
ncbi:MAG: HDIG domain-containing protein [Dehalococcoidales bacterium]|nr:HDIG domain-containing protein [Dehalococcoidales bacterium]